jgi:arsenate reductase-like glutaredoxin family protein
VKAREFLVREHGEEGVTLRNLIKEPLTEAELRALAKRVGGIQELVAPKRRKEVEGLSDKELVAWLASDGARLRRPIIQVGSKIVLGFNAASKAALE